MTMITNSSSVPGVVDNSVLARCLRFEMQQPTTIAIALFADSDGQIIKRSPHSYHDQPNALGDRAILKNRTAVLLLHLGNKLRL
jgi:hypothetical protein